MEKKSNGPLSSLPVDRLTATDCNADRSCQNLYDMGPLKLARWQVLEDPYHTHDLSLEGSPHPKIKKKT